MTNKQSKIEKLIAEMCPNGVEVKELREIADILNGYSFKSGNYSKDGIRVVRISDVQKGKMSDKDLKFYPVETRKEISRFLLKENDLVMSLTGNVARVAMLSKSDLPAGLNQRVACIRAKDGEILTRYLFYFFDQDSFETEAMSNATGGGQKNMSTTWLSKFKIPIPPLAIQQEIVKILDSFTELETELEAELEARKRQYEYYRDELLSFGDEVERKNLEDVFNFKNGYTPSKSKSEYWENGTIPWFRMEDIRENGNILDKSIQLVNKSGVKGKGIFPENSIIVATSATIGEHALVTIPHLTNQRFVSLSIKDELKKKLNIKFIFYYFYLLDGWCLKNITKSSFASVDMVGFRKFKIPIPPLSEQKRIVSILDKFDALVNGDSGSESGMTGSLPAEFKARRQQYEYYRNKLLTFTPLDK